MDNKEKSGPSLARVNASIRNHPIHFAAFCDTNSVNAVTRENSSYMRFDLLQQQPFFFPLFLFLSLSLSPFFTMAQSHPTSPMSLAKICNSTNDDDAPKNLIPSLSIDRDDPNVQLAAEALGDMARTQGESLLQPLYTT